MTGFWQGRRVLVTGQTGFKGSWLCLWLHRMGAVVTGYGLAPPTNPSLFALADVEQHIDSVIGDVRDLDHFERVATRARPEIIFHLAAQSLVRVAYDEPLSTYATNVMGTANVLDAARRLPDLRALIVVTSDKCYDNRTSSVAHRESDPLGGSDPYSSSKAAAELVTAAYRQSYFQSDDAPQIATVRAGNVLGGGDWARDRLIPDVMTALLERRPIDIRSPFAIRPWQHVLEPLHGYLMLAERMAEGDRTFAAPWNFGPGEGDHREVLAIVNRLIELWGAGEVRIAGSDRRVEAAELRVDSTAARQTLGWQPHLTLDATLEWIVGWYRRYDEGGRGRDLVEPDFTAFENLCSCPRVALSR